MISRRHCLIELSFIEEYSKLAPTFALPDDNNLEAIAAWANMYAFICRSDMTFNCTPAQFSAGAQTDITLKQLWKKSAGGECSIQFNNAEFNNVPDLLKNYPLSVFISKNDKSGITSKYGIINVNINNFSKKAYFFKDNGAALRVGENWDWENIRSIASESANAMLIVDNYIFKGDVKSNLIRLLDVILPQSLDIEFHMTVFYIESRPDSEQNLKDAIHKIRPNLNIVLEFVKTSKDANNGFKTDFHDRAILTNNLWIDSGAGFNILKRDRLHFKAEKSTTISLAHVFFASKNVQWLDKAASNLIDDANDTLSRKNISSVNRLLK